MIERTSGPAKGSSAAGARTIDKAEFSLTTMGLDIGSSTTHFLFARLDMAMQGSSYVVAGRTVLFSSDVLLTPYTTAGLIDTAALRTFLEQQRALSALEWDDVDTGAVILTGLALERVNARSVGELVAQTSGRFVVASAGDELEAILSARGSGALEFSATHDQRILHVDVGGGTTKLALCDRGTIRGTAAIDIGARHIVMDAAECLRYISPSARRMAQRLDVRLTEGTKPSAAALEAIFNDTADHLASAVAGDFAPLQRAGLVRWNTLDSLADIEAVSFSGGVSEYIYGRHSASYSDMGLDLARFIVAKLGSRHQPIIELVNSGIRSTVVGASQYTVQASSQTIFVSDLASLPLRNVRMINPDLALSGDISSSAVAEQVLRSLRRHGLLESEGPVAVSIRWQGSLTFPRLSALAQGLAQGMTRMWSAGQPAVLVADADIGGLLGAHIHDHCQLGVPVVCLDGIDVGDFDFIDIDQVDEEWGGTTVVVKSLEFADAAV